MKIAIGTLSEQKLGYFSETLNEINIVASVFPIDAASGISDQPTSSKETRIGSVNRARFAFESCADADMAIGIEVGYHPNKNNDYKILCWVTLIDKSGKELSAKSHNLLLPEFHQKILKGDKNLGDFVRQYINETTDPSLQELGEVIRSRKPFIQTALKLALWEWMMNN